MKINPIVSLSKKTQKDKFSNQGLKIKEEFALQDFLTFDFEGIWGDVWVDKKQLDFKTVSLFANAFVKTIKQSKNKKILIGRDNRKNGEFFSEQIKEFLITKGFDVYFLPENRDYPSNIFSYIIEKENFFSGIYIGAGGKNKNINGIKIYDKNGYLYGYDEYKIISEALINKKDIKKLKLLETPKYIDSTIIEKYILDNIESLSLSSQNNAKIKIAFSPLNGSGGELFQNIFQQTNDDLFVVKNQFTKDSEFKRLKNNSSNSSKVYRKVYRLAARTKADLGFVIDSEAKDLGVFVKYKKRYKFLKSSDIAAIYLDYKLNLLKENNNLKEGDYIVKSNLAGDLIVKIANDYGVKIIETPILLEGLEAIISNEKGNLILAADEKNSLILDSNLTKSTDSAQTILGIVDAFKFFKSQNKNLYEVLLELNNKYGIHRIYNFNKSISRDTYKKLIQKLNKEKHLQTFEIAKSDSRYISFNQNKNIKLNKVYFKKGSWMSLKHEHNQLMVSIQNKGQAGKVLTDIVVFEKRIADWINDNTETFESKEFTWKGFFKYFIFIWVIVGIMAFVFLIVYKDASKYNSSGTPTGKISPYSMASIIANSSYRWLWLLLWSWTIFNRVISAWKLKRMLYIQGEKAKVKHLFIGQIMGGVVSFVTPLTIGGDAIGYWYMRRKGIERGPLIAAYATDTLLFQAKFTLQTIILVAVGFPIYEKIFMSNDSQANAALIWFIVGTSWTIFATFMIFLLTLSKRFQEWIIGSAVRFLEWSKLMVVFDPGYLLAKYQYEFWGIRQGMKKLWLKWWFSFEMLFYYLAPLFFNPITIVLLANGWINSSVQGVNGYMAVIVIDDIIGTANSMSLTPGGSGTQEWLTQVTKPWVYNNHNYSPSGITSGVDLLNKLFYNWPLLLFSTLLIFSIVPLENYRIKKEVFKIIRYKSIVWLIWIFIVIGFLIYFFLVLS